MSATVSTVDNLVIGGGLAGSMAAILLANAGRSVMLVEKERAPHHKVCGEFLSPEAVEYLRRAGVDPLHFGAAIIRSLRLSSGDQIVEASLPFTALSLSRRTLDEALLSRAAQSGCTVERGVSVERLTTQGQTTTAQLRDGRSISATTAFLATGKHDLRGQIRAATSQTDFIGFKMHWHLAPAQIEELRGRIEVFLFPGGYGGLSLIEGDLANLCFVIRRGRMQGWSEFLAETVSGDCNLRLRLQGARALWERPLAISPIPYGHLANGSSALWRIGDQAVVIPSFTGDGMSIALHSAALAAQIFLAGKTADDYQSALRAQLGRSMFLAGLGSRAMVSRAGRFLLPRCFSLFPNALRWMAASTRIPQQAILTLPALSPTPVH